MERKKRKKPARRVFACSFRFLDPKSIMMYSFPGEFATNKFSAPSNVKLSAKDKAFIRKTYPKP